MRKRSTGCLVVAALAAVLVAFGYGQDSPSPGEEARHVRQEKPNRNLPGNQAKDAKKADAADAKTVRVITNDEIPSQLKPVSRRSSDEAEDSNYKPAELAEVRLPAETWKAQIEAQKSAIVSLQSAIDKLNDSIHFSPSGVQWNQRQREKQQGVEQMRAQLDDQKKRLEDMQESARRQGYGSSVYDP